MKREEYIYVCVSRESESKSETKTDLVKELEKREEREELHVLVVFQIIFLSDILGEEPDLLIVYYWLKTPVELLDSCYPIYTA